MGPIRDYQPNRRARVGSRPEEDRYGGRDYNSGRRTRDSGRSEDAYSQSDEDSHSPGSRHVSKKFAAVERYGGSKKDLKTEWDNAGPPSKSSINTDIGEDNASLSTDRIKTTLQHYLETMGHNLELQKESMRTMNGLMETLQQVTHSILEIERTRLRSLELETEEKTEPTIEVTTRPNTSYAKGPKWQGGPNARCFRCNDNGHQSPGCPLAKYHLWYCYFCKKVTDHKGDSCYQRNTGGGHSRGGDRRYGNTNSWERKANLE